jgi:hypothetical protein
VYFVILFGLLSTIVSIFIVVEAGAEGDGETSTLGSDGEVDQR